jgi:hypothetical protein
MTGSARNFLFIILFAFLYSCANQVAPQGGEKDTKPPKILKAIPENYSTNFSANKIQLTFDEYIQLKDVTSQLIVSPPLAQVPEAKIKQKTLIITMDDTLKPNTTYTMNFGNSILDNNEGNPLENFQFVFSTGNILDTLKISGTVENADDKKTDKGILVMLYKNQSDPVPLKNKPDYFAKTDEKGKFSITNIAPGVYRILALKESNADYLYNAPGESVAFTDSAVTAGASGIPLRMFIERPKQQIVKAYSEEPGKAVVAFAEPATDVRYKFISDSSKMDLASIETSLKKDTLIFWYKNTNLDSLVLFFTDEKAIHDTVAIRLFKVEGKKFSKQKRTLSIRPNFKNGEPADINKVLILNFNHPVVKWDFTKINFTEDSVPLKNLQPMFLDSLKKTIAIQHAWKEKSLMHLFIQPGAFTDIFGLDNDTTLSTFKMRQLTDYGTLSVKLKPAFKGTPYLVELIDDKENVCSRDLIHGDTTMNYSFLEPKIYKLKAIEDLNENNKWDTGNLLRKIQPEQVWYYPEALTIRANWDVEVTWHMEAGK